ncbi:MAG: NrsF family protein [Rhizomicrobium sp.]
MMSKLRTEELIAHLTRQAEPVRCLSSPQRRTAVWLAWSLPWVAAVVFIMGLRPDLTARLADPRWLLEEVAALATGVMAAMACFCAGVPGRPHWEHFLPLIPLAVWLATLGHSCVEDWRRLGSVGLGLTTDWQCLPAIMMTGIGPAVVIGWMIRNASPITPMTTTALAALAAGGVAAAALRLFHPEDTSLMVLVWQAGTVFVLTLIAALLGKTVLRWRLPSLP